MDEKLQNEMADAIFAAERKIGCPIDFDTLYEVMKHSIRKLEVIGRGEDYLPVLLETELCDHAMREEINRKGELNRVLRMYEKPVRQPVSQCS